MKVSRDWLSDFIDWIETDSEVIADRMTRGMGEVEEVIEQGGLMDKVVVGKIQTLAKHPNADKLSVCDVQTDDGTKHVVCGGTNLKQGMLIAFAHVGATVKAGGKEMLTLSKVKIRGEDSEGMICAAEELEIEALYPSTPDEGSRPIADLTSGGFKPGTPLRQALRMNDVVFHIDNHAITNRPDLFSHIGVARELVAMGVARWKKRLTEKKPVFTKENPTVKCINEIPNLVSRYIGCTLTIDTVGSAPEWMRRRLEATGWRSINLPVDITNYVSMELGMPLHCFDADDIDGDVHIRTSKRGESIITLDSVKYGLPEGAVVLSDKRGIFDLLGIMGGLRSSTKESTKHLYLHAAIVDPVSIRRAVTATGNRTEASTIYEKGIPRIAAEQGFLRALELILTHVPGARVTSRKESWGKEETRKPVKLNVQRISEFIGMPIAHSKMKKILTDLGCTVKTTSTMITVTPPAWRRDLTHGQDIIEEVARVYGYANIPPAMPEAGIKPPERDTRTANIRDSLSESGAFEMLHLAFTSPAQMKRWNMNLSDAIAIENPIGEEISLMRIAIMPSLIETAARELKNSTTPVLKVYEVGNVFRKNDEHAGCCVAVLSRGRTMIKDSPLLVLKADIIRALAAAGYEAHVRKAIVPMPGITHEGRSAEILVGDTLVGHLFELHPALQSSLGLAGRVAVATLGLHRLLPIAPVVTIAKPLPVFPSITFDETLPLVPTSSHAAKMAALKAVDALLESVETVDFYEKEDSRTITLRFTYRSPDRTLTQEEVEKIHSKVLAELKKA